MSALLSQVGEWSGPDFDAQTMVAIETFLIEIGMEEAKPGGFLEGATVLNETTFGGQGLVDSAPRYSAYVMLGDLGPAESASDFDSDGGAPSAPARVGPSRRRAAVADDSNDFMDR